MCARTVAALLAGTVLLIAPYGFAATPAAPRLAQIVLAPPQIGPGYRLVVRSDSICLSLCATLDLCGFSFASEGLRIARLQVNYVRPGRAVALSNEVVRYRPGGAGQALAEARRAVARCPSTPVSSNVKGVPPLTYRPTRLVDRHLLPGYVALRLRLSGGAKGTRVDETVVDAEIGHSRLLGPAHCGDGLHGFALHPTCADDQHRAHAWLERAQARDRLRVACTGRAPSPRSRRRASGRDRP